MREPLLLPLAAIATGITISQFADFTLREPLACGSAFLLLAALAWYRHLHRLILPLLLGACLAIGILTDVAHKPGPAPEIDAGSTEVITLEGCIVEPPVFTVDREQFLLELAPKARVRVSLTLRPDEEVPRLTYGQHVEVDARVRKPRNFGNPGAFDYVKYLSRQNIYWTATARAGTPIKILNGRCGSRTEALIFTLRTSALSRIEQLYPNDPYAIGMMEAILIGESTKLEKVWTEHFRRTGTYHALVISGLHITVLAGTLLFLLRLCMIPEMTALLIAAVGAWLYAAVSGWSAPVVRAAGGFTLYLIGRFFFRRGRVLNLLSAVGIAYLLWDPGQLFDASFQLSFFSVAAIGAFAVPLLETTSGVYQRAALQIHDLRRDPKLKPPVSAFRVELRLLAETVTLWTRIPTRHVLTVLALITRLTLFAYEMMMVSAIIQVALALPMALYFHRISITGLSANLLIVPTLSAVVPIGFAAIFTGWHPIAWIALILLHFSEWVANFHVRFEPALRVPDPPLWVSLTFVAALILTAITLRLHSRWRWPAGVLSLTFFGILLMCPFAPDLIPGTLELTTIDVGQGDALFLALPDGRTMLIDAGGIPAYGRKTKPKMDIGEDVVSPYLWTRRLHRVDIAAITHLHEDHVGGLLALLENFRPRELWTGAMPDTDLWRTIEKRAHDLGIKVVQRHAGEHLGPIEVLAPIADYEAGEIPRNNDSLALRVVHGEHSFLLMGDMEKQIEYQLAGDNVLKRSTVLKVAHHGSKTSSTEEFLNATEPMFAIISAGFENSFHHPHPDIVQRLTEHHIVIMRTDLEGLLTIRSDGHRLTVTRNIDTPSRGSSDPNFLPR